MPPGGGDALTRVDDRGPVEAVRAQHRLDRHAVLRGDRADRVAGGDDVCACGRRGRRTGCRGSGFGCRRGGEPHDLPRVDGRRPGQPVDRKHVGRAQPVPGGDRGDAVAGLHLVGLGGRGGRHSHRRGRRHSGCRAARFREQARRRGIARACGFGGVCRGRAHQNGKRSGEGHGHARGGRASNARRTLTGVGLQEVPPPWTEETVSRK